MRAAIGKSCPAPKKKDSSIRSSERGKKTPPEKAAVRPFRR